MDSYFILWVVILYSHVIFSLKLSQVQERELLQPAPVSFHSLSSFLEYFLSFWLRKMSQAYLAWSLPQPRNGPFLQGALVPFREE